LPKTDRVNNRAQLVPILEAVPAPAPRPTTAALEAAKVPCGAINNLAEVFADPTSSPATWWTWQHPIKDDLRLRLQPDTQTQQGRPCTRPAAAIAGATHPGRTAEVLDYSDPEIVELQRQKVI
jgi:crotonobetainyl-CoA:carnitine CoA-transferase CaiB-like acyl-CoA transferase